jgi:nucleoside-triphosphatase THEP1
MHVFLTGLRGIGKTTVITKIVCGAIAAGIVSADEIAGFHTVWTNSHAMAPGATEACATESGDHRVHLVNCGADAAHNLPGNRGADALYILPYEPSASRLDASDIPTLARPVAVRDVKKQALSIHTEVFDEDGVAMLRATNPKLIIMDELGFMESGARAFQKAVMDTLNGDAPVLGVMRWEGNPFLDAVRAHEKVSVVEVNENNRDDLPAQLTEQIFQR